MVRGEVLINNLGTIYAFYLVDVTNVGVVAIARLGLLVFAGCDKVSGVGPPRPRSSSPVNGSGFALLDELTGVFSLFLGRYHATYSKSRGTERKQTEGHG